MRQHLQSQAGYARELHRSDETIVVLIRIRPSNLHCGIRFLRQFRTLAGFQRAAQRLPRRKTTLHLLLSRVEPAGKGSFCGLASRDLGNLAAIHQMLRFLNRP